MALTVVATVGSASANSYVTLAEANTIMEARLYVTDWSGATDPTKNAAIVMATRLLDALYEWTGYPVDSVQALCWPRSGMLTRNGYSIGTTTIPTELKAAVAELALTLVQADPYATTDAETEGITSLKAGPIAVTFAESVSVAASDAIAASVRTLIPPSWGRLRGRSGTRELVRA